MEVSLDEKVKLQYVSARISFVIQKLLDLGQPGLCAKGGLCSGRK